MKTAYEVFNRKTHPRRVFTVAPTISFYLNSAAVNMNGSAAALLSLSAGDKVAFLRNSETWHIVKTQDANGYILRHEHNQHRSGLKFHSRAFVNTLCGLSRQGSSHFLLHETGAKYDGQPVFELLKKPK